jgi:tRNA(Ile)-lysidine synthase
VNHATLQDRVRHALGRSTRGTVVAAVSGGPDSMAMFHALCVLARDIPGLRVVAAHFDHRLRPGSEHDIDVINNVAERFDVRVFSDGTDIAARARESSVSIESAGRIWRYTFFENVSRKTRAGRIATAHTRDDQVETVMMRILRGADSRGLRGIAAGTDTLLRPLLDVTHTETIDYCETHGVPYIIAPTTAISATVSATTCCPLCAFSIPALTTR